jgi:ABC-2 type transport system permease protein
MMRMTWILIRKLLRDLWVPLAAVMLLLGAFQVLWALITERILGRLAPFFNTLAGLAGLGNKDIEAAIFEGPVKIARTLIGGETVSLDRAMDMLSIGYVHPLMVIVFCIWAVGRASGAIAGEIDRGTMELLLAQPLARSRLVLAHLAVDLVTIPLLCLSLWTGNCLGAWVITPIRIQEPDFKKTLPPRTLLFEVGPLSLRMDDPLSRMPKPTPEESERRLREQLKVEPLRFGPALVLVGGLLFALSGSTMWLSAAGRFRWRVLGVAVFATLIQFLVNLLGQMWDPLELLRPLTIFYYYQPQQAIVQGGWMVDFREWNGGQPWLLVPMPLVLYGVGAVGYLLALRTLVRRDLPAPL